MDRIPRIVSAFSLSLTKRNFLGCPGKLVVNHSFLSTTNSSCFEKEKIGKLLVIVKVLSSGSIFPLRNLLIFTNHSESSLIQLQKEIDEFCA